MKIALCLSGQPRSLQEGFHYHSRNLIEEFEVDVFVHSWNSDFNGKVLRLYKPTKHKFEDYLFGKEHDIKYEYEGGRHDAWPPRNALHGFYSIYQANRLKCEYEKENGFVYDWVVRSRFDYALNVIINFKQLENHFLYVPERSDPNHYQLMCDQFAFSSSSIMDKYSETFLHIDEFHESGCFMIGEHLAARNARKRKLVDILRYYDMDRPFKQYVDAHQALIRDDFGYWKKMNFSP
jgi:hypothetical protein